MPRATALCSCLLVLSLGCAPSVADGPPNLILIIGDDHGYPDFGFMGSDEVETPRLDRLAAEGAVFPIGYSTASVCRPALRTLLTGLVPLQYEQREQRGRRRRAQEADEPLITSIATLPRLLGAHGYRSFQAGKLWEGHFASAGFDEGMVLHEGFDGAPEANRLVRETLEPVFDFLERSRDGPFFLWFAPLLPHLPHNAPDAFRALYPEVPGPRGDYYASISWFDSAVGQLLDRLESLDLPNRTLVAYVADNGWDARPSETPDLALQGGPQGKMSLYELGLRTPVVLHLPGVIAPAERTELVSLSDLFPTFLHYAEVPAPADRNGHSLRDLLEGGAWPRQALVGWVPVLRGRAASRGARAGGFFWRDPRWHYLAPTQGRAELYDLAIDPRERRDVLSGHPEVAQRARDDIDRWVRGLR